MFNANGYQFLAFYSPGVKILIAAAGIWTLIWKGMALWRAGQNGQKPWFVVLLLVNTLGILDIVYLVWFGKRKS